ncbi:MAG: hypothetical protein ACJ71Y_11190 [Blastococcus sp.]|jgi:hypothetical protein
MTDPVRFGAPGCTCRPFTRTDPPRFLDQPGDTIDRNTSWQRGQDCEHHAGEERDEEAGGDRDFDRDPAALAWARGKVQEVVDKAEECAANDLLTEEIRERWRHTAGFIRHELLTREGVVRAAFDERWPDTLAAWDVGPTVREAAANDRRWPLEKAGEG